MRYEYRIFFLLAKIQFKLPSHFQITSQTYIYGILPYIYIDTHIGCCIIYTNGDLQLPKRILFGELSIQQNLIINALPFYQTIMTWKNEFPSLSCHPRKHTMETPSNPLLTSKYLKQHKLYFFNTLLSHRCVPYICTVYSIAIGVGLQLTTLYI